ncbi:MAG: sensor domain-containing diguanylate cyclase [Clostridia bacterium]|nr:sensor domain-containing diguanylate cyclase [Clostridia bacterium]
MTTKPRFSLKKKLVILIVSIIAAISILAGLFSYKGISDISRSMYISRSKELSATAAAMVDPQMVRSIRDRVMAIFDASEDRVSNEEWESPGYEAYLAKYDSIQETDEFKTIQRQLRVVQDNNAVECVYLVCFDLKTESTVYLVDGTYGEDNSPPGCFDAVMYDVDHEAMKKPENGIAPDVTNTPEYGWVVAAGSPVFLDGELVAFAAAELSMNEVMNQRNRYLLIALSALLLLAAVFIALSIILIDRTIIRPINKLSDTSEKYWRSGTSSIRNEFSQLQIHTGDEIETLSNSMKQMEQNINEQFTKILETTQKLITTREHADEMDRIANVDALTKVRNKRAYDENAARLSEGLRTGDVRDFGIAMIDLNDLKKINDNYGHDKGDIAIQRLCGMICAVFKHSPVFRLGGDEFAVVLEGHDLENVDALMRQLQDNIDRNRADETLEPWERTSAAVGFARYGEGDTLEAVFKRADKAMYARKTEMKAHVS